MKSMFWILGLALILIATGFGYIWGNSSQHSLHANPASANHGSVTKLEKTEPNKILYYRNPMGLADTSPTPKKDSMGMDYLPVYANDTKTSTQDNEPSPGNPNIVHLTAQKVQTLGVQTHAVKQQFIGRDIRALGSLQIDESSLIDISPRFEGWITNLTVNTLGQRVNKGEIMFVVRIPNLITYEQAFRKAIKKLLEPDADSPGAKKDANNQMARSIENLDEIGVSEEEMHRLQSGGEPYNQMHFRSPISGVVIEKNITLGSRFSAGERLYKLANLSKLWLVIQLPEQELSHVRVGDTVKVELLAERGKYRTAKIDFIYPSLDIENRGLKLRATLDNTNYALKPGQTAEVWLQSQTHKALVIPSNALLDSGSQQWVLVALGEGNYQPRQVQVGERNLDWIEIITGLNEGEQVVTSANFLIDSESRLQTVLASFNQSSSHSSPPTHEHQHSTNHSTSTLGH